MRLETRSDRYHAFLWIAAALAVVLVGAAAFLLLSGTVNVLEGTDHLNQMSNS